MPDLLYRARATMLGLAAGNMLDLPAEFELVPHEPPITDIDAAELRRPWDDDLAQAFDLAESLARHRRADPRDLAARLTRWSRANGRGLGNQTAKAIALFEKGFAPLDAGRMVWEQSVGRAAGNGGVMRVAPVGLAFHDDPAALARAALDATAITHFDPRCTQGALAVAAGVAALLHGENALAAALAAIRALPRPEAELVDALASVPRKSLDDLPIRAANGIGYTVTCTAAGFWAVEQKGPLEEVLLAVVNAAGDADTNGAVAGALLGARHGIEAIPERWLERIRDRGKLEAVALKLVKR
ncbi:MAG: ADP-ribosylglycohydrolase family protein [Planctomycetes bacterium]|nr:ADP-ribosylglycohydrolase family protein [Planctomycetota bacterium]